MAFLLNYEQCQASNGLKYSFLLQQSKVCFDEMQRAKTNNVMFIHADEAVFIFNTFINKSWYKKYYYIEVYEKNIKVQTFAILALISEDIVIETYFIYTRSIKQEQYIEFLEKLRANYQKDKIVLFVDNLSVDKTEQTKKTYERLNITPVFNVTYSPEFNGIEFYWSLVKSHYKKLLLYHLKRKLSEDTLELIKSSARRVSKEKTIICARRGRINVKKKYQSLTQ